MKLLFKESFARDLKKVREEEDRIRIKQVILATENASTIHEIPHVKKLQLSSNSFRIRVGNYRIGVTLEKEQVTFVRCLHRRDIYRYFP